ncbi:ATP-binding protein [Burkholderia cenocepacia]|uniref:ATP-binding protein n=1 Tax=Burkholderia cenocepacia TaxID=95486 RepID=UPI002B2445AE|nr:ATP-binding protein [Burkholderia cenocepacia]MEB2605803.1 ATP-binding protein [Burkholderia cenocepacia]
MATGIDQMFQEFIALEPELTAALNEAPNESDTRLKALDRILFEILGWRHESIFTEPVTPSGYIDYLLTVGERRGTIVIEAKRSGLLKASTTANKAMVLSLNGPVLQPLKEGIRQALAYATEQGTPVAVLTDGRCWLFFKASRTDGLPPLQGKGIFFPTIESVRDDFPRFAELLALPYVLERRHLAHLNSAEGVSIGEAEEQYFVANPADAHMKPRDALATDASLLFSQFFSRLSNTDDKEMVRACFVETPESRRADFELQKIVQNVLNGIASLDTAESSALQAEIEKTLTSQRSETVLLVGNKGSGKSTFIDRFFGEILPFSVRQQCSIARVNLDEYSGDPSSIVEWAIRQLRGLLEIQICANQPPSYDDLQGIFWGEYVRWKEGPRKPLYETNKDQFKIAFGDHMEARRESQPEEYVRLLLKRSTIGLKRLPCIVFDNTDQFSSDIQDKIYQLAHSLESASAVFIIVPITDRTVWRLSKAGALQSYAAKSFYLPVPEAKEILSRRVRFVKEKISLEKENNSSYFSKKGFSVSIDDLSMFADAVERIFVDSDYVSGLIGRLANFDIRRMLRLAERIFLSPEIKIDDIVKSHYGGPSVSSDKYRTHRALIKGEYDRFSEMENEYVCNLFYTDPRKPTSPLLALYVLWILRQRSANVRLNQAEARHWLISELCDFFEACGVSIESVLAIVTRLFDRRLLETLDPNVEKPTLSDRIAIKESGIAHIELLGNSSVYMEQMALTTGINSRLIRDELKQKSYGSNSQSFVEMRDVFIAYLLKIDSIRVSIPQTNQYRQLNEVRAFIRDIRALDRPGPRQQTTIQNRRGIGIRAKQFGVARKNFRGGKSR